MRFHLVSSAHRRKQSESQKGGKTDTSAGQSANKSDEKKALHNHSSVQRAKGLRRKVHKKSMLRKESTDGFKACEKIMRKLQQMSNALEI